MPVWPFTQKSPVFSVSYPVSDYGIAILRKPSTEHAYTNIANLLEQHTARKLNFSESFSAGADFVRNLDYSAIFSWQTAPAAVLPVPNTAATASSISKHVKSSYLGEWLIWLYSAIDLISVPDEKQHFQSQVWLPYMNEHLDAETNRVLVYPLVQEHLRDASKRIVSLSNALINILSGVALQDLNRKIDAIITAVHNSLEYVVGSDVTIQHIDNEFKEINEKLDSISNRYKQESITLLKTETTPHMDENGAIKRFASVGSLLGKVGQLLSINQDYVTACVIDQGLIDNGRRYEKIDNIIEMANSIENCTCKKNVFEKIEQYRDISIREFITELRSINSKEKLNTFYEGIERRNDVKHIGIEENTCGENLVFYFFFVHVKKVLQLLSKEKELNEHYNDCILALTDIETSFFAKSRLRDFSVTVQEILREKIAALYTPGFQKALLAELGSEENKLASGVHSVEGKKKEVEHFLLSIKKDQRFTTLIDTDTECIRKVNVLWELAESEGLPLAPESDQHPPILPIEIQQPLSQVNSGSVLRGDLSPQSSSPRGGESSSPILSTVSTAPPVLIVDVTPVIDEVTIDRLIKKIREDMTCKPAISIFGIVWELDQFPFPLLYRFFCFCCSLINQLKAAIFADVNVLNTQQNFPQNLASQITELKVKVVQEVEKCIAAADWEGKNDQQKGAALLAIMDRAQTRVYPFWDPRARTTTTQTQYTAWLKDLEPYRKVTSL